MASIKLVNPGFPSKRCRLQRSRSALLANLAAWSLAGGLPTPLHGGESVKRNPDTKIADAVWIDFAAPTGTRLRNLNGMNLGPQYSSAGTQISLVPYYRRMNVPRVRLHDVPLNERGMRVVDVAQIFGNWNSDPADPDNYYFVQTDDYLKYCLENGMRIKYRLGASIEHSPNKYFSHPPEDYDKWIDVCSHIIALYNEGWNHGFQWDIRYWEIWCEPNEPKIWSGTRAQYFDLYVKTAIALKKRFPAIKVGGPALGGLSEEWLEAFLAYCKEHHAPIDFISWDQYNADPAMLIAQPARVKALAEKYGYPEAELEISEWHYLPTWSKFWVPELKEEYFEGVSGLNGYDAAAYTAMVLSGWQDTPLGMAYFYTGGCGGLGCFTDKRTPKHTYYALEAIGTLMRYPERVHAVSDVKDVSVLAGRDRHGRGCAVISAFRTGPALLRLRLDGIPPGMEVEFYALDKERKLQFMIPGFRIQTGTFTDHESEQGQILNFYYLPVLDSSVVYLLRVRPPEWDHEHSES